jgi:hypothetical protein
MNTPTFQYVSLCCSSPAVKPACVKARATAPKKGKKEAKAPETGLGHWSCGTCGKACKVSRHNRPEEKATA